MTGGGISGPPVVAGLDPAIHLAADEAPGAARIAIDGLGPTRTAASPLHPSVARAYAR
jgi:hypothetical protein